MAEHLSAYEKQRLANIERNQSVLEQLGLAKKKQTTEPVSTNSKQRKAVVSHAQPLPLRVMPKRGQGQKNYSEYFRTTVRRTRRVGERRTRPHKVYEKIGELDDLTP